MAVVTVRGIPENITRGRLVKFLRCDLLKNKRAQLLVTIADQECKVQFKSKNHAVIVHGKLQGFEYVYNCNKYILHSTIDDSPVAGNDEFMKMTNNKLKMDMDTLSTLPPEEEYTVNNIPQIDKVIELTKKKRLLIEEKRKLLLEQKKLALLKSSKNPNSRDMQHLEGLCESESIEAFDALNQRWVSEKKTRKTHIAATHKVRVKVFAQLAKIFYAHTTAKETYALRKVIHMSIKHRILDLIKDKAEVTNQEVYDMYRVRYPEEDDEGYVKHLILEKRSQCANGREVRQEVLNASDMSELREDSNMDGLDDCDRGKEKPECKVNECINVKVDIKEEPV